MRRITTAAIVLALLGAGAPTFAAVADWRPGNVNYVAEGKDIKDVLRDFAASQGMPAVIPPDLKGTVTAKFNLPPQKLIEELAATFGFVWYFDGQVLDIEMPSSMRTAVIRLDNATTNDLRTMLKSTGVADVQFPITYDSAAGTAIVNGPPRYVELVSQLAARLDSHTAHDAVGSQIKVFPLQHAWAADHEAQVDGNKVTIPGVAKLLNQIYHPQGSGAPTSATRVSAGPIAGGVMQASPLNDVMGNTSNIGNIGGGSYDAPPLPPALAATLPAGTTARPSPDLIRANEAAAAARGIPLMPMYSPQQGLGPMAEPAGAGENSAFPVIQADPRTNSILIRDLPGRVNSYQSLIAQLDVKPRLVEIDANIIEIDTDALEQLGVDWRAHNSHVDLQTGNGATAQNTFNGGLAPGFGNTTLAGGVIAGATPVGASMTAVLGDAGRFLLARVNALQQANRARIDASPKIATLDHVEAVVDNKQQFFVPVNGYVAGNLYSISTGVSLRVLPMIVDEDGKTQIKLDVSIEDGQISGQAVGNLPVVTKSTVNTEAFINQGQALLIGGYRMDNDTHGTTGVPGLSKIPLIGGLFRYHADQTTHMERLFVLTPRVIEP
jgi:type III secretion protein C